MDTSLLKDIGDTACGEVDALSLRDLANVEIVLIGGGDITGSTY
jgi:hypothetical protein